MTQSTATTAVTPSIESGFKRADRRSTITVLVLGDEAVGKSSLISTFVSRYFSEVVPGIMTRVRLPPDPETNCVTSIVDSQQGDVALMAAAAASSTTGANHPRAGSPPNYYSNYASEPSLAALMTRAEASLQQPTKTTTTATTTTKVGTLSSMDPPLSGLVTPQKTGTTPTTPAPMTPATTTAKAQTTTTAASPNIYSSPSAVGGVDNVDSIVLVYDLDRVETFFRLENHWLPLIERCYNGKVPVIVAENKLDLYRPSSAAGVTDEQAMARKRQQIVSLMQRFPFVQQCIKCSAKNLLRVDDVFLKAQQAVLYPFTPPLYDLETGQVTVECKRAFTRIFRMHDSDHDGLLSDSELDRFQRDTYQVAVFDRDFAAWKKVVTRNNPSDNESDQVIVDGKFTVAGFLAIFDVFISQNRLDVVWQALRKFGYDDDLNLHVPETVTMPADEHLARNWKLSSSAKTFLTAMFHQFDSDKDGELSVDDILNMFSILPPPSLPPWHPLRIPDLFKGCFSVPLTTALVTGGGGGADSPSSFGQSLIVPAAMSQSLSSSGISILSAGDSLPSVDVAGHMHPVSKPLSFLEWMGCWNVITAISPALARAELFRLGHVEEPRRKESKRRSRWKKQIVPSELVHDASLRSREIRVLVLGSRKSGKTALLNYLRGGYDGHSVKATDTRSTTFPVTSTTFVKLKRKSVSSPSKAEGDGEEFVVHLVFTEVPEAAAASQEEHYRELTELFGSVASPKDRICDLAMLVFDTTNASTFSYVKELESTLLTKETPRVFVGTKADLLRAPEPEDGDVHPSTVMDAASIHCRESELEAPMLTSAEVSSLGQERGKALDHFARCALSEPGVDRLRSKPHEEQKRREAARRRKMLWLGGIVSVGVVVVVGVGLLWGSSAKKDKKNGLGWLRSWFAGGPRSEGVPSAS